MTFQVSREEGLYLRQTLFDQAHRVVVKVGSAVLAAPGGLDTDIIDVLARDLAFLRGTGREVILVSSGAVAAGRRRLDVRVHGGQIRLKQALAAVGQGLLMQAYEQAFAAHGQVVAQILLTHEDLRLRERYLNVRNTFQTLFDLGAIPVVNENDTVSVEELRFGDNDRLAAMITHVIDGDMLLILSDVDGLYTANPQEDPDARPVYTVREVNEAVLAMAGHSNSALGTGGMRSKIEAARMTAEFGAASFIGPGRDPEVLKRLFSGEPVGTFFLPRKKKLRPRKGWLRYFQRPEGVLVLDEGACQALVRGRKSLLPSGIKDVRGEFGPGAALRCEDRSGRQVALGLTNYGSGQIRAIMGRRSAEIEAVLGYHDSDEVIHRDNLVLVDGQETDREDKND